MLGLSLPATKKQKPWEENETMSFFIDLISILLYVLMWAIIIRAILSWFSIRPDNPLLILLDHITEPILAPLRRIVPRVGMFDITPIVAILLLWLVRVLLLYVIS